MAYQPRRMVVLLMQHIEPVLTTANRRLFRDSVEGPATPDQVQPNIFATEWQQPAALRSREH